VSVRRLAPSNVQPASFAFSAENAAWAAAQLGKYPAGRQASAVIPLLMRAQDQEGWVSEPAITYVADYLGMAKIRVLEVATFYTQFQLAPVGSVAHVQLCGTTPCMLCGSEALRAVAKRRIHPEPFHLSADGKFSWEEVECLGACVNAPMALIGHDTFEDLTPESFEALLDAFARGERPKVGVQTGRRVVSEQEGGATTLTDPALYDGSVVGSWHKAFEERAARAAAAKAEAAAKAAQAAPAPAPAPPPAPASPPPAPPASAAPEAERAALAAREEADIKAKLATLSADATPEQKADAVGSRPAGITAARGGAPDRLQRVKGIGPVNEGKLNQLGIFHFDQIAAWTRPEIRWVGTYLAFPGRIDREDWTGQARVLASGGKGLKD